MKYDDLTVLIPSHSLEDFPQDLTEPQAASLMNGFAVRWHPVLLAGDVFPRWERSDAGSEVRQGRLVIVPTCCNHIPSGWLERSRREGMTVITDITDRQEMLAAVLKPLGDLPEVDPDLVADFLALGTCHLLTELLSRQMRHFSHLDEPHLRRESIAAAQAAVAQDVDTARQRLKHCFDMIQEARERVYGVDCYLLDLCLIAPQMAGAPLLDRVRHPAHFNLLATSKDLQEITTSDVSFRDAMQTAFEEDRACIVGGEWEEAPTSILSLDSVEWQLRKGLAAQQSIDGARSTTWGRRRFGLSRRLPQVLSRLGFVGALHVALDDGIYPDDEQTRLHWEGLDGTAVEAFSRIPLAADSATTFLRFSRRMSESMDHDHAAALVLARWPELKTPWMDDLYRIAKYAPVLGRFVTFTEFFKVTDMAGRIANFHDGDYFSPYLVHSVARQQVDPVSRYQGYWQRRAEYLAGDYCGKLRELLQTQTVAADASVDDVVEAAHPDAGNEEQDQADAAVADYRSQSLKQLSQLLLTGAGNQPGWLVVNPLSFTRRVVVEFERIAASPETQPPVVARQCDDAHHAAVVEIPGCGFVWLPRPERQLPHTTPGKVPVAEPLLLRNEFFEVGISETTGGIAHIKPYTRSPNRLSHQIAFRFPRVRKLLNPEAPDAPPVESYYSEMRMTGTQVLCSGPGLGAIETTGEIVNQENGEVLAGYRQMIQLWRGRPVVDVEIELEIQKMPEGDPWSNYYAVRFAWKHESAVVSRSDQHAPRVVNQERIESPEFIEIADNNDRTTILPMGLPFHRKTGNRMLDTLLVVAGETRRHFHFQVMIDVPFPLQAALDGMSPALTIPTESGPPRSGETGWFFHLDTPHVQLMRILPLRTDPNGKSDAIVSVKGCILRLMETEGRRAVCRLSSFLSAKTARQVDLLGKTIAHPKIEGDEVRIEIAPFEVCDVELTFG